MVATQSTGDARAPLHADNADEATDSAWGGQPRHERFDCGGALAKINKIIVSPSPRDTARNQP